MTSAQPPLTGFPLILDYNIRWICQRGIAPPWHPFSPEPIRANVAWRDVEAL